MDKVELTDKQKDICMNLACEYLTKLHEEVDKLELESIEKMLVLYTVSDVINSFLEKSLKEKGIIIGREK